MDKVLGVFADQTQATINADLDHIQSLGADTVWVVLSVEWAFPSSTTIDATVAAHYDDIINGAFSRNMRVVVQAHGMPTWITTASGHSANTWHGPDTSGERTSWIACVHNFINRYGSTKIDWVEVWNEPNTSQFWVQGPSPDNYVRLLQATYVDIKATWPTIQVVGHNMSRSDFGWLTACYASTDTIFTAPVAAGNKYYFDVLGVHPYCGDATSGFSPSDTTHADEAGWASGGLGPDFLDYRRFRAQILTKEGINKSLAFGEFGYAVLGSGWFKVSASQRASYLQTAMTLANSDLYVDYFNIYYHWRHETPSNYGNSFNIHGDAAAELAFTNSATSSGNLDFGGGSESTQTLNYNDDGTDGASSSGCTNSIVTTSGTGHLHDMGGAANGGTPNGTNPAVPRGTYTFWNDLSGPWAHVRWQVRPDLDTQTANAGYFWSLQGNLRNAADTGTGSTWYAGIQSRAPNPKGIIFSIWEAVTGVAGDIPGTVSQQFTNEGTGWQLLADYAWVAGRTYTMVVTAEPTRGERWFACYIRDETTQDVTWLGSIQAATIDGNNLAGVAYQWTELFSQVTPATTCPLLPRSTTFFGQPIFSTSAATQGGEGEIPGVDTTPLAWYVPTGTRNPNSHGTTDVYRALTGRSGSRRWSFRYELLDNVHNWILDLDEVLSCRVEHQYLADIKRQATFTIRDRGRINYLSDRIKVFLRLHLAPYGDDDWVEWPLGVFLLAAPTRHANEVDVVEREVQGFDPTQALEDDKVTARYALAAGANVVNSAAALLTVAVPTSQQLITRSTETLTAVKEWPPGTSKRQIMNELLSIAEFESVSFDSEGRGIIRPYVDPNTRAPIWTYEYGDESLIIPDMTQELDLFSVPNRVLLVVSEPDQPMLVASATNSNPASITSTVRRGRTIVDFREEEEASSQSVLNARALRILRDHATLYEHVTIQTGLMPIHGTNDTLQLIYDPLAISAKYAETAWTIECVAGAPMIHEVRRLVSV